MMTRPTSCSAFKRRHLFKILWRDFAKQVRGCSSHRLLCGAFGHIALLHVSVFFAYPRPLPGEGKFVHEDLINLGDGVCRTLSHPLIATIPRKVRLVYGILQELAGAEFDHLARRDLDICPGPGVATGAGFAFVHLKRAEAGKGDFAVADQDVLNGLQEAVEGTLGVGFGQTGLIRNFDDQFCLGHVFSFLWKAFA